MSKYFLTQPVEYPNRKVNPAQTVLEIPDGVKLSRTAKPLDAAAIKDYCKFFTKLDGSPITPQDIATIFPEQTPSAVEASQGIIGGSTPPPGTDIPAAQLALAKANQENEALKARLAAAEAKVAAAEAAGGGSDPKGDGGKGKGK